MTGKLQRDTSGAVIAGVCAGLADGFSVSPVALRAIAILWALATPVGVLVYAILWLVVPDKHRDIRSREETIRCNVAEIRLRMLQWGHDLHAVFGDEPCPRAEQVRRVMLTGILLTLAGFLFFVDHLRILGVFRLHQLASAALILSGLVFANHALHS